MITTLVGGAVQESAAQGLHAPSALKTPAAADVARFDSVLAEAAPAPVQAPGGAIGQAVAGWLQEASASHAHMKTSMVATLDAPQGLTVASAMLMQLEVVKATSAIDLTTKVVAQVGHSINDITKVQ